MRNSQLTEIIQSFDRSELKEFGKFIRSPYFNNRSEVIRFFDVVKKYSPKFDSKELSEESIFEKVYPGKKYSNVLMRKLYSLTTNLLTDFIAIKGFRESTLEYNVKLIDKLRERKLPAMFEKKSRNIEEKLEKSKRDVSYYETKLKHTSILNGHFLNTDEKSMVRRLQNELDDLVEYFLVVALVQYIRLGEWSRALNKKFDLKFYEEVINHLSEQKGREVNLASLYFNMLMLLNTEEEKYYLELIKGRDKFESCLSDIDAYNIAIVSMQYCHKKVMKGKPEYRRQQFDITKKILEKKLIPAGYIEPYFFTNIIRNASNINEFEWSENFVDEYRHRLNPEFEEEITDYSLAMIEFCRGNFESSLRHLSKINIERSNMKLDVKNLLIVIYYELDYTEELISMVDAYKHFLNRDKTIAEHSKTVNLLFLKFVSELIKIHTRGNKDSAFLLKKEIENSAYFNLKDWLIRKAEAKCN